MNEDSVNVTQIDSVEIVEAKERASYDIQVATAKRFPRDVQRSLNNAVAVATMDKDTAESCGYALPRGNKPIQGPSVHLAKIVAQNWGNIRVEAKVVDETRTQIVSSAVCFDLENNIAVKVEVRRKITDKSGNRFNDDMITVTGNAANSISLRNAIFAVIPESFTKVVYNASMDKLAGDLSSDKKLSARIKEAFKFFKDTHAVTEKELLTALGLNAISAIEKKHIILLRNMKQSLIDGDSSVNTMFGRNKNATPAEKKESIKNKQNEDKIDMP